MCVTCLLRLLLLLIPVVRGQSPALRVPVNEDMHWQGANTIQKNYDNQKGLTRQLITVATTFVGRVAPLQSLEMVGGLGNDFWSWHSDRAWHGRRRMLLSTAAVAGVSNPVRRGGRDDGGAWAMISKPGDMRLVRPGPCEALT